VGRRDEIAPGAVHRFYQVAPPGSFLMLVASNFPTRLGAVQRLEQALLVSPRFRVVHRNGDATLLRLRR
jgi:hypothetical protein